MNWIRDALFVFGLGLLAAGLYLYDPRLALVVPGGVLVVVAMVARPGGNP